MEVTISTSMHQYALVATTNGLAETIPSQLNDHMIFDRVYLHGIHGAADGPQTGIYMVGSNISTVNSYIDDIGTTASESHGLLVLWSGPHYVHNNFIAAPNGVFLGGTGTGGPYFTCTIAASPAPTTTTATVNTCINQASGAVATPAIGTYVMFYISSAYGPANSMKITGNTAGALTFCQPVGASCVALPSAPDTGAGKIVWGQNPNDLTMTQNLLFKYPSWNPSDPSYNGVMYMVKTFYEQKSGQRNYINGNVGINSWNGGQQFAFNVNSGDQGGVSPQNLSSDVTVTNNLLRNIAGAFVTIASQNGGTGTCPAWLTRVKIANNLFYSVGAAPFIPATTGPTSIAGYNNPTPPCPSGAVGVDSLQIVHNNLIGAGIFMATATPPAGGLFAYTNLVFQNNIGEFDQYWITNSCTPSMGANYCFTNQLVGNGTWTASNNGIINSGIINGGQGVSDATLLSYYPTTILTTLYDTNLSMGYSGVPFLNYSGVNSDYHNYALTGGAWKSGASDGTDVGVNITSLDTALYGGTPAGGVGTSKISISGNVSIH